MATRTLTVVFTDIKGFTRQVTSRSREELLGVLDAHEQLLLPVVEHYGGRVVKTLGEAFLLVFEVPTRAVLAGVMMQKRLREYNAEKPEEDRIHIGVAIHTGEVEVVDDSDVFGDAVNIASRIQAVTGPGEVFLTEATYLSMSQAEVPTAEVGSYEISGIAEAVQVYRVIQDETLPSYQTVVEKQDVPASPPRTRGAYSRSLLYSVEPSDLTPRTAPAPWLRWAVTGGAAAAVLIVFVVGALVLRSGIQKRRVAGLIEQKRSAEALSMILALQRDRPADVRLQELAAEAADAEISRLLADWEIEKAMQRLDDYERDFPYLANQRDLYLRVQLQQVQWYSRTPAGKKVALDVLNEVVLKYPENRDVKFAQASFALQVDDGMRAASAVPIFQELMTGEGGLTKAQQDQMRELFRDLLTHKDPDDFSKELRDFIDAHIYSDLRPFLEENLLGAAPEGTHYLSQQFRRADYLRRNAYIHLKRNGDIDSKDEFRFFTLILTDGAVRDDFMSDYTFPYFRAFEGELPPELAELVPDKLTIARCLDVFSDAARTCRTYLSQFYAQPLRESLEHWVATGDERPRVNSYWILHQHGWTTPEMDADYHMKNLADYDPRYASFYLGETMDYYASIDRRAGVAAIPLLEEIVAGTKTSADRYRESGQDTTVYDDLNRKARAALAHLK